MSQVYLLTGKPGTGKTSLVKQVAATLGSMVGGFYTEEIRNQGVREGFRLVTLEGQEVILAHVSIKSPYWVSKYGVDVEALKKVGVPALQKAAQQSELIIIDEIGKMELFSREFREVVIQLIEGKNKVLGTIMLNHHPWADTLKQRPEVKLVVLTRDNYPMVLEDLLAWLKEPSF